MTVDPQGNVYVIADTSNPQAVRRIDARTGNITIFAGAGSGGSCGNSGLTLYGTTYVQTDKVGDNCPGGLDRRVQWRSRSGLGPLRKYHHWRYGRQCAALCVHHGFATVHGCAGAHQPDAQRGWLYSQHQRLRHRGNRYHCGDCRRRRSGHAVQWNVHGRDECSGAGIGGGSLGQYLLFGQ